jgi:hypothetical protein
VSAVVVTVYIFATRHGLDHRVSSGIMAVDEQKLRHGDAAEAWPDGRDAGAESTMKMVPVLIGSIFGSVTLAQAI